MKVEKVEESKKSNKLKVENVHVGTSVVPRGYLFERISTLQIPKILKNHFLTDFGSKGFLKLLKSTLGS